MTAMFPLGRIVATPGALAALEGANQHTALFLARHAARDWGELDLDSRARKTPQNFSQWPLRSAFVERRYASGKMRPVGKTPSLATTSLSASCQEWQNTQAAASKRVCGSESKDEVLVKGWAKGAMES